MNSKLFKKLGKKKKGTYTRPEGWEKTIARSAYGSDRDYTGKSYKSYRDEEEKKDSDKRRGSFFNKLKERFKKNGS